jgi:hypothetical protein
MYVRDDGDRERRGNRVRRLCEGECVDVVSELCGEGVQRMCVMMGIGSGVEIVCADSVMVSVWVLSESCGEGVQRMSVMMAIGSGVAMALCAQTL